MFLHNHLTKKAGFPLVPGERSERVEEGKIPHFDFLLNLLRHRKLPQFWDVLVRCSVAENNQRFFLLVTDSVNNSMV